MFIAQSRMIVEELQHHIPHLALRGMGGSFAIVSYLLHHVVMANNLPDARSIVFTATTKFQKFISVIKK